MDAQAFWKLLQLRWRGPGGYREVLEVGLPLVVSMGSTTLMHFTDRVFLSNYSVDAIAAALPAGITSFFFISFFMGVASYVNVFVAQYTGAVRGDRVGASLWQGIYFSLASFFCLASLYFAAGPMFSLGGHPPEVMRLEVVYFQILTLGAGLVIVGVTLSCFFSGRGLTRPVMVVNLTGAAVNIPLDYALINGYWVFPELGIVGAGIASVVSQGIIAAMFAVLVFTPQNEKLFKVWSNRAFDRKLFTRLMRFGFPSGIQFFVDMFAITFFVFMIGRLGKTELAATNIVFAIDTLAFLPMIGFSVAVSTLVGQSIGRGVPLQGVRATGSTLQITLGYMVLVAFSFVAAPEFLLGFFKPGDTDAAEFGRIVDFGVILLRFVAAYSIVAACQIIYFGALKGAGDIWYPMWAIALASLFIIIVPVYLGINYYGLGLQEVFACLTSYIGVLALAFWRRFRRGKWQQMSVIEKPSGAVAG